MEHKCTCARDWRAIPKDRRITLEEPGAIIISGRQKMVDRRKIHIYDKNCPKHGYQEIVNE